MQPAKWFLTTILIVISGAFAVAAISYLSDPYGLYRGKQTRRFVYGDPRVAKYLLNQRYVPENFDAILLGPSMSTTWNLTGIEKLRVYNDSLNGANAVEESAIADAAVRRPGISAALVLVHPAITATHDFKTVRLAPELTRSALGSVSLWEAYIDLMHIKLHRARQRFDAAGTEEPEFVPTQLNENMKRLWIPAADFEVDPQALLAYGRMIGNLRAHHVQIVFVVPPTFEGLLEQKRAAFDRYTQMIRTRMGGTDDWIDFASQDYTDYRKNASNFTDQVHFTPSGARRLVAELNAKVNTAISNGSLRVKNTTAAVLRGPISPQAAGAPLAPK